MITTKFYSILLFFAILFAYSCNKSPNTPECINPIDGATNVTSENLILKWSAIDEDNDILVFDLLFAEDSLNGVLLAEEYIVTNYEKTTYTINNLKDTTKYIWGIKAKDPKGNISIGIWTFTTGIIDK